VTSRTLADEEMVSVSVVLLVLFEHVNDRAS
jgi:hypothetical protein